MKPQRRGGSELEETKRAEGESGRGRTVSHRIRSTLVHDVGCFREVLKSGHDRVHVGVSENEKGERRVRSRKLGGRDETKRRTGKCRAAWLLIERKTRERSVYLRRELWGGRERTLIISAKRNKPKISLERRDVRAERTKTTHKRCSMQILVNVLVASAHSAIFLMCRTPSMYLTT